MRILLASSQKYHAALAAAGCVYLFAFAAVLVMRPLEGQNLVAFSDIAGLIAPSLAAALLLLTTLGAPAFGQGGGGPPRFSPLLMESTAFEDGGIVPQKYAGREGVQPGFTFSNAPDNAVSYAIIFHDLDVALQGGTPVPVKFRERLRARGPSITAEPPAYRLAS